MKRHLLPACLFSLLPVALSAQTVRGVVVDQLDRPLAGVVVQLTDSTSRVIVRALSNERGEYRLTAPASGRYRVRSTRIGFRPSSTEFIELTAQADVSRRMMLTSNPVVLDRVTSTVRTTCRSLGLDSTAQTFTAWEQVRAALQAADVTSENRNVNTTTLTYERRQNLQGTMLRQGGTVTTASAAQPWHSVSADSLRRVGYVVTENGLDRVFHGPDVGVLASELFLEDHCFRIAASDDPKLLGVAFEPVPDRKNRPEITGTMWLDRETAELRSMQWHYLNIAKDVDETETGGEFQFARLRSGAWVISRWNIRMPLVEQSIGTRTGTVNFRGIKTVGGEMVSASSAGGADTLWASRKMTMHGFAFDSLNKRAMTAALIAIAGTNRSTLTDSSGHFHFDSLAPGAYRLITQHEGLEGIGISAQATLAVLTSETDVMNVSVPSFETIWRLACESVPPARDTALIYGTVRGIGRQRPVANATVMATWVDVLAKGKTGFSTKRWRLDGTSDATGSYVLCGVPTQSGLRLRAVSDSAESGLIDLLPLDQQLVQRRDIAVSFDPNAKGVVIGTVVGRNAIPIAGARVGSEGTKETRTDAQGRFILRDVPLGTQQVDVVAVGLQPVSSIVEVSLADTARIELHVEKPVMLARVNIVASSVRAQFNQDFEDRKIKGIGTFRDSSSISAHGTMTSVLTQIPGIRTDKNLIFLPRTGGIGENGGGSNGCLANIWIDNVKVQSQDDLQALRPSDIAVIEVYQRELAVPMQFMVRGSNKPPCGVIVVWTKWFWDGYHSNSRPPV